ncbi:MAG: hypothetical protein WCS01_07070 [bacterium]
MTACAMGEKLRENVGVGNLFLPVPDTDFCECLPEVLELSRYTAVPFNE